MAARPRKITRLLETDDDVREGVRSLRRKCDYIRRMHDIAGHPPIRRRPAGLEGLCRIIVAQQVSVASAAAIWGRTAAVVTPFTGKRLAAIPEAKLKGAGLSAPKIRTLKAIAQAVNHEGLELEAMSHLSDEEIHAALTRVSGIGPWTADIFLMFCLGRADAFAAGDLALQIAAQMAMGSETRPSAKELHEIAERWRPWRNVAALLLWAYYKEVKQAKSGAPA